MEVSILSRVEPHCWTRHHSVTFHMQNALLLTHGAGSSKDSALLIALDLELTALGWTVERVNLAFRESGKPGPPRAADQVRDREQLAVQLTDLRARTNGLVCLGGHSYGGRQGSMLLAEQPGLADGLLLMGYPLHPPGKPEQLRVEHLPKLVAPVLFVSGTKDEFGTPEDLRAAVAMTASARKELLLIDGARHDLKSGKGGVAGRIAAEFHRFSRL